MFCTHPLTHIWFWVTSCRPSASTKTLHDRDHVDAQPNFYHFIHENSVVTALVAVDGCARPCTRRFATCRRLSCAPHRSAASVRPCTVPAVSCFQPAQGRLRPAPQEARPTRGGQVDFVAEPVDIRSLSRLTIVRDSGSSRSMTVAHQRSAIQQWVPSSEQGSSGYLSFSRRAQYFSLKQCTCVPMHVLFNTEIV